MQKMKRKASGWWLCCLCLLSGLCVACSDDDDDPFKEVTVVGTVVDAESNWKLADVNVELYIKNNKEEILLGSTVTGKDGTFKLTGAIGTNISLACYVSATKSEYRFVEKAVTVQRGKETEVHISMHFIE